MRNLRRNLMFTFMAALGFINVMNTPQAQASDWGCRVLLCASNPAGWQNISECRPPMIKLIRCLAKTNPCSWPTCPEAGTGGPGFEPFAACPAGTTPGQSGREGGFVAAANGSSCGRNTGVRTTRDGDSDEQWIITGRPRNPNPYYFDIPNSNTGQTERFRFNLNV